MYLYRLFLCTFLYLINLFSPLLASQNSISYERFYRLNNPLYRSESGDFFNLSYSSHSIDATNKIDFFAAGDLRLYFNGNNAVNYSLQEAYARYNGDSFQLTIGRKILDWNTNEKYWSLGYLNANQSFTLLSGEEEGVTGLQFKKEIGSFEFDLLLSYLFIPQVNPSLSFKNGEVVSQSDWVRLPPKKTVVTGQEVPIYYKLNKVNIAKIIFNKSVGGNIRYKWNQGGISAFAIYKPENSLRVNASAYYDNVILNQVVVETDPTVNHHAYYGIQVFQNVSSIKIQGGLSFVDPNMRLGRDFPVGINNSRKNYQTDYFVIHPRYDKEAYSHLSANLDKKTYSLSLNYIHLLSKNFRASDDFYSDTVKWKKAIGGTVAYAFSDSFKFLFDLKYDIERFDNIVKSEIVYNFKDKVLLSLGVEMLKAPLDNSYWSYYRANDTFYSSVGLLF